MKKIINFINKNKKACIILTIVFFICISTLLISFLSKTYALDGFGTINLSCDNTTIFNTDSINCTITGTVASTSEVSSLSAQINLSDNLELSNVTVDSSVWQGDGEEGDIKLYTDSNKSGTFNIVTFTVKPKGIIYNAETKISLSDVKFYEGSANNYKEQVISEATLNFEVPTFSSEKYDLTKDYIVVDTKSISNIISSINTTNCNAYIYNGSTKVTSGDISDGYVLKVMNGTTTLKEYELIYYNSSSYDLTKDYLIESTSDINTIKNNVNVINGSLVINNNELLLTYNNSIIKRWNIINITSSKYSLSLSKDSVIIDSSISESILTNFSINRDDVSLSISENKLNINYLDSIIKSLNIITVISDTYLINLNAGYIFGNNIDTSKITTNGSVSLSNNKLTISNSNGSVGTLNVISITSSKYQINDTDNYIYTKVDNTINSINQNLNVVNGTLELNNDILSIKYNNINVIDYKLLYIISNDNSISDSKIIVGESTSYSTFISKLTFKNLDYEVLDSNNNKITSGNINDNYKLNLYYDDTLLDTYSLILEYLNINDLNVSDDNIIYDIPIGTTSSELLSHISTSGTITVDTKSTSNVLNTGDKVSIKLSSRTVNYTISVYGDVTGSGNLSVGDVAKIYQFVRNKIELNNYEKLSADVTGDGNVTVADVAKSYQFLRGKIGSLK